MSLFITNSSGCVVRLGPEFPIAHPLLLQGAILFTAIRPEKDVSDRIISHGRTYCRASFLFFDY